MVEGANTFIFKRRKPLCDVPEIGIGNKPIDGGQYLFTAKGRKKFLKKEPSAKIYFQRWLGSDEFINGSERWCLWLGDCPPQKLRKMPTVMERIEAVKKIRENSESAPTRKIATTPTRFHVENMPKGDFLVIPKVSSERRYYIPIGFKGPETFCGDAVFIVPNTTRYHFGILTSAMHMAWVRYVCGRLKSDYRYSKTVVYNNFPWPEPIGPQKKKIEEKAQAVLSVREKFSKSSLADLYDPNTMPPVLLKAHRELDRAVDSSYRKTPFKDERTRIEFLFDRYQQLTAPLIAKQKKSRKERNFLILQE